MMIKTKDKALGQHRTAVLLFGPTASGKTGLSLPLAQQFNGEIINADSRQVYRHMPIITAMPEPHEFAAAPHHLFDFLEPTEHLSVVGWGAHATPVAEGLWQQDKVPFFVGGTGFYLKYLIEGMSRIPATSEGMLSTLKQEVTATGIAPLYDELRQVDPEAAERLAPRDTQRIMRAVALWRETGTTLTTWQKEPLHKPLSGQFLRLGLCPPREVLYARIHARFDDMLKKGLVEEAEAIYRRGYDPTLPALTSIGFPLYFDVFEGRKTLAEANEKVLQHMRNYAKRQTTWMRQTYKPEYLLESADPQAAINWLKKNLRTKG